MPSRSQGSKWIRPVKRQAIYNRDGKSCIYCMKDLQGVTNHQITLDHIVPWSACDTPDNSATNLVTACLSCNASRCDRPLEEWLTKQGFDVIEVMYRVAHQIAIPLNIPLARAQMEARGLDAILEG